MRIAHASKAIPVQAMPMDGLLETQLSLHSLPQKSDRLASVRWVEERSRRASDKVVYTFDAQHAEPTLRGNRPRGTRIIEYIYTESARSAIGKAFRYPTLRNIEFGTIKF